MDLTRELKTIIPRMAILRSKFAFAAGFVIRIVRTIVRLKMKFNKPWPKLDLVCRGWDAHIYLILGMGEGASASANDEPGIQNPYNKERRFFIASMILRWRVCYGTFFSETLEEWIKPFASWTELKFGTKRSFLVKLVRFLKYRCSGVHVGILMLMNQ